jgi:glycosyltransferase involved in cell wall biosynthesis
MFSICLCSWNDLHFLKILVAGIKKNTKSKYEIIVHDNGSVDGTKEWLESNGITHTRSEENEGVAAVNYAVKLAKYPYIIDINADMYPLPGWDLAILKQISAFQGKGIEKFTISSCLVEPIGNNPEYTITYHGHTYDSFNEQNLLQDFLTSGNDSKFSKGNTTQYSHPITMPKKLWDEFGGVDTSYKYGIATDHDIAASAYAAGCRDFIMLGKSRVYHFVSQTIRKLPADRPNGHQHFQDKWGISIDEFRSKLKIATSYSTVADGVIK